MKYLFISILFLANLSFGQSKPVQKFVKEVNANLSQMLKNRIQHTDQYGEYNFESTDFLNPFLEYPFEVLEPFQIDAQGNITMKLHYKDPENPFNYKVTAHSKDLKGFGVDIYFLLLFEENQLTIEYEYLNTGEKQVQQSDYLHLGIDQVQMRKRAEAMGLKDLYYYP